MPTFLAPVVAQANVNLLQSELQNARVQNLATAPGTPVTGQLYYDTDDNVLYWWNGSAWVSAAGGAGAIPGSLIDAKGDLILGTGDNAYARQAAGANGTLLVANSALANGVEWRTLTEADIQVGATDRLLGRDTAAAGPAEELTATGGIEFTGTGIQTSAFTGDVTKGAGGTALTIASNAVTFAKLQDITTDRLLGRDTAATGDPEELTVGGGLEFTGTAGIQTSARTGDVTKAAGGTVNTIAADAVTNAKLANMAANSIKGNNTGGVADPLDLTVAQAKTLLAIVPADVAGFDTQVRTSRLDQMAAPTAAVAFNAQRITGLAAPTAGTDATNRDYVDNVATGLDVKASVRFASTANVAGTYNATGGTSARGQFTAMSNAAIDGVTPAANDRVLLKDQSTGAQNGIWVITTLGTGADGVWNRATDFDQDVEVTPGAFTFVEAGTANQDSGWVLTTNAPIVIGGASGTALVWAQFSGAGQITAGNALSKTGNTLDVMPGTGLEISADTIRIAAAAAGNGLVGGAGAALDVNVGTGLEISADAVRIAAAAAGAGLTGGAGAALDVVTGAGLEISADTVRIAAAAAGAGLTGGAGAALAVGAGTGITVNADDVAVNTAVVVRKFAANVGDAAATSIAVAHNLGTRDVQVTVYDNTTPFAEFLTDVQHTDTNTVTLIFATAPAAAQYRCVVQA